MQNKVRAIFWLQGENNKSVNPEQYYDNFKTLREDLYNDFPATEQIFMFQITSGCGGGGWGWNTVFEAQRKLAEDFDDIHIIATSADGIAGCHYGEYGHEGYTRIAEWMFPLVDIHLYGESYTKPMSSPNIIAAAYTDVNKDEIVIQFDQVMTWMDSMPYDPNEIAHTWWFGQANRPVQYLKNMFVLDSAKNMVTDGRIQGDKVYLSLNGSSTYKFVTYPPENLHGSYPGPYLMGENGTGTLGFTLFPILDQLPTPVIKDGFDRANQDIKIIKSQNYISVMTTGHFSLEIYDSWGKIILENTGQNYGGLDLSPFKLSGLYFLRIVNGSNEKVVKLFLAGIDSKK